MIIRGNSASGKTTLAKALRAALPKGEALLISQDTVRREMLGVNDRPTNLAIGLIKTIAEYGYQHCHYVILEGILGMHIYQVLFEELTELFQLNVAAYYFDIPFEETIKRHNSRPQAKEFDKAKMREWWLEKDYLGSATETFFNEKQTKEELLSIILGGLLIEEKY